MRTRRHTVTSLLSTASSLSAGSSTVGGAAVASCSSGPSTPNLRHGGATGAHLSDLHSQPHTSKAGIILDQHNELERLRSELSKTISMLCEAQQRCTMQEAMLESMLGHVAVFAAATMRDAGHFVQDIRSQWAEWASALSLLAHYESSVLRESCEQELVSVAEEFRFKEQALRTKLTPPAVQIRDVSVGTTTSDDDGRKSRWVHADCQTSSVVSADHAVQVDDLRGNEETASLRELLALEQQRSALVDVIFSRIETMEQGASRPKQCCAAFSSSCRGGPCSRVVTGEGHG